MPTSRCKVTLRDARPAIWRRIDVPSDATLADVHHILQVAMGWTDSHLHQFEHAGVVYAPPNPEFDNGHVDERRITLAQLLRRPKQRLIYEYDFGDSWTHDLVLEEIVDAPIHAARVTAGAGACPPEDVGGIGGYDRFLDILRHPSHPEHADMTAWIGGSFDPRAFDLDDTNARLARVKIRHASARLTRRPRAPKAGSAPAAGAHHGLALQPGRGRPLNRKQQAFNRLVSKVEQLRAAFDEEQRRLDALLISHAADVQPLIDRVVAARLELVRALRPFLVDRRLKRADARELRALLSEQLDDVLANGVRPDAELNALFEELNGESVAQVEAAQMADARDQMEQMFADEGLDIDLSGFRPDMTQAELAAASAEMATRLQRQMENAGPEPHSRRAGTKRRNRGDAPAPRHEAPRLTSVGMLYRRLAKVLHPDLESDPALRARKSTVMQELTAAHAAGDMHTLLRLELEWFHHEDRAGLTDDALDGYVELLKEQAATIEMETDALPFSPRYAPITRVGLGGIDVLSDPASEARRLDGLLASIHASLARLQGPDALREVRDAIAVRRRASRPAY